jgi:hypothetical protein
MNIKKYDCGIFIYKMYKDEELKFMVSFIHFKPILDIFSCGFSFSSCPQHSLKALMLLNSMCLLNVKELFVFKFSYLIPGLTLTVLVRICCIRSPVIFYVEEGKVTFSVCLLYETKLLMDTTYLAKEVC